jgi:hypothetical protein
MIILLVPLTGEWLCLLLAGSSRPLTVNMHGSAYNIRRLCLQRKELKSGVSDGTGAETVIIYQET